MPYKQQDYATVLFIERITVGAYEWSISLSHKWDWKFCKFEIYFVCHVIVTVTVFPVELLALFERQDSKSLVCQQSPASEREI